MQNADNNNDGKAKGAIISIAAHVVLLLLLISFTLAATNVEAVETDLETKEFIAVELVQPKVPIRRNAERITPAKQTQSPEKQAPQTAKVSDKVRAPKANDKPETKATTAGETGDVERYEKPQPKINPLSLLPSTTNGETDGHQNNKEIDKNKLFGGTGQSDTPARTASTPAGPTTSENGVPFSLEGRKAVGGFPKPKYEVQKEGIVVVEIRVNQDGVVISAQAKAKSHGVNSTVQDDTLWKAAEDAARRARFNVDKNAAAFQMGIITYTFILN